MLSMFNFPAESAPIPDFIVAALNQNLVDLSNSQQSKLASIEPLAESDPGSFKSRIEALRAATRQAAAEAINHAYDSLEHAATQYPERKSEIQQAVQGVQELVQSFTVGVGKAFDKFDHAGALVIDGLSEGPRRVADAFSDVADGVEDVANTVGNGVTDAANTVGDGFRSVFGF